MEIAQDPLTSSFKLSFYLVVGDILIKSVNVRGCKAILQELAGGMSASPEGESELLGDPKSRQKQKTLPIGWQSAPSIPLLLLLGQMCVFLEA